MLGKLKIASGVAMIRRLLFLFSKIARWGVSYQSIRDSSNYPESSEKTKPLGRKNFGASFGVGALWALSSDVSMCLVHTSLIFVVLPAGF